MVNFLEWNFTSINDFLMAFMRTAVYQHFFGHFSRGLGVNQNSFEKNIGSFITLDLAMISCI